MHLVGRALARVATRVGGQLMVELPDDLAPRVVAKLVEGANDEVPLAPAFALFVRDERPDVGFITPSVDFRELAGYRLGNRLALTYSSDNRGMATYTSVYQLLLSSGFPASRSGDTGTGVASLPDFARALADILLNDDNSVWGLEAGVFRSTVQCVLAFLAGAHEAAGNGQASFASDWWLHVGDWTEALRMERGHGSPNGVAWLYGCAGLPVPDAGAALEMTPKEYVSVLKSRWTDPTVIMGELGRLQGVERAKEAAAELARLAWDRSQAETSLFSDSVVTRVALAVGVDRALRAKGWGALLEDDFRKSYVEARGRLRVRRSGCDLPVPLGSLAPVLIATPAETVHGQNYDCELRDLELIVPFKEGAGPDGVESGPIEVRLSGSRNCRISFHQTTQRLSAEGLHLTGQLEVTPAARVPNVVVVEANIVGQAASALVDRCSGTFTLLRPDEVGLWSRPHRRSSRSNQRGPIVWSSALDAAARVDLSGAGEHEFAVAWGEAAQVDATSLSVGTVSLNQVWLGLDSCGRTGSVNVAEAVEITSSGRALYRVELGNEANRPLSPVVAAAHGVAPDTGRILSQGTFGYLEAVLGKCLATLSASQALGCILVTNSPERSDPALTGEGVWMLPSLQGRDADLSPGPPSAELFNNSSYARLRAAYRALELPASIARHEEQAATAGLTISRISLQGLPAELINELLDAYCALLVEARTFGHSDRFWARHPFSVVVLPEGAGLQVATAVLLSPLHPIRLAWLWALQTGLQAAHDDGMHPSAPMSLLDPTPFPAYVLIDDAFGSPSALIPVPIDAYPEDLYIGWHASVSVEARRPQVPEWVAGRRFPVDGLSALSASSVGAAVDDFLRVFPHVQNLRLELAAVTPARRSSALDDGVLEKLRLLAVSSTGLDGVAGVRVHDSTNRIGPIPQLDGLEDATEIARPGFNAQWSSVRPVDGTRSHVTFLEGSAAQFGHDTLPETPTGWVPKPPLRRTPRRLHMDGHLMLDYSLAQPGLEDDRFAAALATYEAGQAGAPLGLRIIPNLVGIGGRPNWLIAADFGADPIALSQAAGQRAGEDYVLWDWRPIAAASPDGRHGSRVQPYFILARVPPSLNTAIRDRLRLLNRSIDAGETERRSKLLMTTLAQRAIGLNTLLAIGHHQATGALGFFFALRSIDTWIAESPQGEVRLVVPIDAVDPFLRTTATTGDTGSRRRADLLALTARAGSGQPPTVVLAPVEIKHYGLAQSDEHQRFPLSGEPALEEHIQQLTSYQLQLAQLCEEYDNAGGSSGTIIGQRLAALLDAAQQLGGRHSSPTSELLAALASAEAEVVLGHGVLIWYQAGARAIDGSRALMEEVSGSAESRRVEVRVDPAAFDECFWGSNDGAGHAVLREALTKATQLDGLRQPGEPVQNQTSGTSEAQSDPTRSRPKPRPASPPAQVHGANPVPEVAPAHSSGDETGPAGSAEPEAERGSVLPRSRLSQTVLEARYARLLAVLAEFGVRVERPGGVPPCQEGPGFIEYAVRPAYGVSVNRVESQLENLKLRLQLPSEAALGCSTHLGNILITIPKPEDERYYVDAVEMWTRWSAPASGFVVPLGEDLTGQVVTLDLASSNSPHVLIAGVTGSGKSEALLTMLHGVARLNEPDQAQLLLVDPKQTELTTLGRLPHTLGPIGSSSNDALTLLEDSVAEMERRYNAFKLAGPSIRNIAEYRSSGASMARWIIVLDEYADLISDEDDRKRIEKAMKRLCAKARAAGIHVIVSTQKPVVSVVNTVVKGNLPGRIALRVNTSTESRIILDESGAEQLLGKGDAILKTGNGRQRLQFARYAL